MRWKGDAAEYANRHLESYDVSFEDLRSIAEPLQDGEMLLLVGSIAEGLANRDSDVDLLLLGSFRNVEAGVTTIGTNCQVVGALGQPQGFDAQITIWSPETVESVRQRFGRFVEIWQHKLECASSGQDLDITPWVFPWLSPIEQLFLHRIRGGIPLTDRSVISRLRASLQLEMLPLHAFVTGVHACYGFVEDAIAQAEQPEGDRETAQTMVSLAADGLAAGLLGAVGEKHPYPKWRPKLLRRHRGILGDDLIEEVLEHLFPDRSDDPLTTARQFYAFTERALNQVTAQMEGLGPLAAAYVKRLRLRTWV